ncbi:hypothetical protein [Rugamonas sp. DEMB1]|uniref:hypothetical protein n=1 Tax=Rugamonas sp. DEMB1 TaxID=3039386 RepID=UPI00244D2CD2|nr:hypothetical protein [Rugamonas sp. DEMB1]WGG50899.1 hypothetical protein QC826_00875 [Rugamonas sp. DEMB1]
MSKLIYLSSIVFFITACASSVAQEENSSEVENKNTPPDTTNQQKNTTLPNAVAWDYFVHSGAKIWACREIEFGKFVLNKFCRDKGKNDLQWPGDVVPSNFRGQLID